jgi:ABC-2 type transport system permease protein
MIVQALRAELFKLSRNRWLLFWAFGLIPAFALVAGLLEQMFAHFYVGDVIPFAAPLGDSLDGLGMLSASIFQLCPIVGAGVLFAGEYRWETWRALLTRNERIPVMLAKMIAFAVIVSIAILLCGVARFCVGLFDAALTGSANWPRVSLGEVVVAHLLGFLATFLQVMATAALVMLASVLTRAMTAAIVAPILLLFVVEIASIRFYSGSGGILSMAFPNLAGAAVRQAGQTVMGEQDALLVAYAPAGALWLILWFLIFLGLALLLFRRQDLSRE